MRTITKETCINGIDFRMWHIKRLLDYMGRLTCEEEIIKASYELEGHIRELTDCYRYLVRYFTPEIKYGCYGELLASINNIVYDEKVSSFDKMEDLDRTLKDFKHQM